MKGSTIALGLMLLAIGSRAAPDPFFTQGPRIVSVTPVDRGAIIGFLAPPSGANTPEILEYAIECSVPGRPEMGTSMFVYEEVEDTSAEIFGLENNVDYSCMMIARGATDGILPRAINSPPSNPTPIFTPTRGGSKTIYLESEEVEEAGEKVEKPAATVPPTNQELQKPVLPAAPSIKTTSVEDSNVKIVFSLPKGDETSPVTGFVAACQTNGAAQKASVPVMVPAGSTSAQIKDLAPGEYTCSVAAQTADGVGKSATKIVTVPKPVATATEEKNTEQQPTEPEVEKQESEKQQVTTPPSAGFVPSFLAAAVFTVAALLFI